MTLTLEQIAELEEMCEPHPEFDARIALDKEDIRELCRLARIGMQAEAAKQDNGHE